MKLAILFGSSSLEHEISICSATSLIYHLDKKKYQITPIYLDKDNNFYEYLELAVNIKPFNLNEYPDKLRPIKDPISYLKTFDLVFIMIHGQNGEDGLLSSVFDFFKIKYLANKPLPSLISMDKILTKQILEAHHIKTTPYLCFYEYNHRYIYLDEELTWTQLIKVIMKKFSFPIFVKPSRSGSSLGLSKVTNTLELKKALKKALKVDNRLLIEKALNVQELECGIIQKNGQIKTSLVGKIALDQDYYSYNAKYQDSHSQTIIPAPIPEEISSKIQILSRKIFKILNLHGYSRCDFFLTDNNEIIFNEINTIPGFTNISMYPSLFTHDKLTYSELLDILIKEALKSN